MVATKVDSSKGRISAKRLLPAARAAGYVGFPQHPAGRSPRPRTGGAADVRAFAGREV